MGKNYGDSGLPNGQNPPLGFTNEIQRNASNTFGISSAAAVDRTSKVKSNKFRNSIPGSLLGFAPFYHLHMEYGAWCQPVFTQNVCSPSVLQMVLVVA